MYCAGDQLVRNLNLSRLTIVIPSFKRQSYLDRQVDYWKDTGVRIEILDGSPEAWGGSRALPPNMRYWHVPESIEKRFSFAATLVETEYAALLSDDEFFLCSGLEACMDYLDAHSDVVSCKGAAIGFDCVSGITIGIDVYPELRSSYAIDQDTPQARMIRHMRPYAMATLWAIMNRDVFTATLKAMGADGPFKTAAAAELQTSLLASYLGKCHVIDELMWLRSFENKNIWWEAGRLSFAQWYTDPENSDEVGRFLKSIEAQISVSEDTHIRTSLIDAINAHIQLIAAAQHSLNIKSWLISVLRGHFPDKLKPVYRMIIRPFRKSTRQLSASAKTLENTPVNPRLSAVGKTLEDAGVKVNFEELSRVEAIISAFHVNIDLRM